MLTFGDIIRAAKLKQAYGEKGRLPYLHCSPPARKGEKAVKIIISINQDPETGEWRMMEK
jgi:hypothetical protein